MTSGCPRWEYRVIHINVDNGPPPVPPTPEAASERLGVPSAPISSLGSSLISMPKINPCQNIQLPSYSIFSICWAKRDGI